MGAREFTRSKTVGSGGCSLRGVAGVSQTPGFADEQRALLGRWHHVELSEDLDVVVELLEGGLARTDGGEQWSWISGEGRLELTRPYKGDVLMGLNCEVSGDGRSYTRGADVRGSRLDPPPRSVSTR